jgi:hypothetical protein
LHGKCPFLSCAGEGKWGKAWKTRKTKEWRGRGIFSREMLLSVNLEWWMMNFKCESEWEEGFSSLLLNVISYMYNVFICSWWAPTRISSFVPCNQQKQ